MKLKSSSVIEFRLRKKTFALRGLLPMLILILLGCLLMSWALPKSNSLGILGANALLFVSGMVFVIMAKRYYRCPDCEKVVVPTKDDGTPSEVSFAIQFKPKECPYCAAPLL
jgi:DNA-directed RNA polymerase subunit RPC12/RpoP